MKTKRWIFPLVMFLVFIILVLIGTFFDLQISKSLADLQFGEYYSKNYFGLVFEVIGELPVYILACCCALIIMLNVNYKNKKINFFVKLIFYILACGAMFLLFFKAFGYVFKHINIKNFIYEPYILTIFIVFSFVITFLIFLIFKNLNATVLQKLLNFAILSILVIALSNAITQGLKPIFTRERFRTIKLLNDTSFSGYTPWYLPNKNIIDVVGIGSDAFKSFPSGHTTSGASLVCLLFLFDLFPNLKLKRNEIILNTTIILWIILVALSRIVMGAHYFSDVVFGGFITIFCYLFFRFLYFKKHSTQDKNDIEQ